MAENRPWESSTRAPPTSSTQTSPLQSGSSQSSHEASTVAAELERPPTLVETLRTCLANATPTEPAAAAGRSDPLRQPLRGSGSKTGMKRRSRASRRVPTTVVEATRSDFRETVHRLTGIPAPTPVSAPVRPQPQRAFMRPMPPQPVPRMPSAPRPQLLNSLLQMAEAPPPMYTSLWSPQPHLDPTSVKSESASGFEPEIGGSSQSTLASTMSQLLSAPSGSMWWDEAPQPQSQSHFLNPTTTTGPFDSSGTSGGGPDDFDDWFHQQDHPGSDYMR